MVINIYLAQAITLINMDEKTKNIMRERRQNQSPILNSAVINKTTGEVVEVSSIDTKTNIKTIHYQHPRFKKWKEDLRHNSNAKIDEHFKG